LFPLAAWIRSPFFCLPTSPDSFDPLLCPLSLPPFPQFIFRPLVADAQALIRRLFLRSENPKLELLSDVDAVTGATPDGGTLSYTWDLSDAYGGAVPPGAYGFFVEGSLRWKNRVLFSGVVEVGGAPITVKAGAEYFYEASDGQSALSDDSQENAMIGEVTVRRPVKLTDPIFRPPFLFSPSLSATVSFFSIAP
jgi:hypothetical protein